MADTDGRWVTINEAVAYFNRSERTLRRWIKTGQIRSKREHGRVYLMIYDTKADIVGQTPDSPDSDRHESAIESGTVSELAELQAQLSDIESERDHLRELLEQAKEDRDYLRQALAAALSKIPQIEAQASELARQDPEPEQEPPRRGWLGRLRDWFDRVE